MDFKQLTFLNYASDGQGGTKDMRAAQSRQAANYRALGMSGTCYTFKDIAGTQLAVDHAATLAVPRGAGLWLWKPYLILQELKRMPEGKLLLYTDSDMSISCTTRLGKLAVEAGARGMALVKGAPFANLTFCKRDCLIHTGVDGDTDFLKEIQVWAGVGIYKACPATIDFVAAWLEACKLPGILTDNPSVLGPELSGYQEHRHDQSVLGCMLRKYKIELLSNALAQAFAHPA